MCQHLFGFSKPESGNKQTITTTINTIIFLFSSSTSDNATSSASTKQANK